MCELNIVAVGADRRGISAAQSIKLNLKMYVMIELKLYIIFFEDVAGIFSITEHYYTLYNRTIASIISNIENFLLHINTKPTFLDFIDTLFSYQLINSPTLYNKLKLLSCVT